MNKILERRGDEFLKRHGPSVEADWRQVSLLYRLTQSVSGMRTAEPLRMDPESECIWYEWLGELPTLLDFDGDELHELLRKAGRGLACLQEMSVTECVNAATGSTLPLDMFRLDEESAGECNALLPIGFFHGDCWHGNIHVDRNSDCVLIDPVQSPWLFGQQRFERANGIVDIATLHMSLLVSVKLGELVGLDVEQRLAWGDLLLDSYLEHFDAGSLKKVALRLSHAIATKYVASYPVRINWLVGLIKRGLSGRVLVTAATRGFEN